MQLVEQLLAEVRILFRAPVYRVHQFRADGPKVASLHTHQIDEARVALHLGAGKQRLQRIEKAPLFRSGLHTQPGSVSKTIRTRGREREGSPSAVTSKMYS